MATIVFVHGIAQEQLSADTLESSWLPALAGGVRNAGHPEIADRLWRQGSPGSIESRMAFYGNLFLKEGQMGAGAPDAADLAPEEAALAEQVALEWLEVAATRSPNPAERAEAAAELAYVRGTQAGEQGAAGRAARSAVKSLSRLPWFTKVGFGIAERFVRRAL